MVELDQYKVRGVQERASSVLSKKEFTPAEIMFGLAEFVGRMIVGYVPGTWVQKKEIFDALCKHMEVTVRIGIDREQEKV